MQRNVDTSGLVLVTGGTGTLGRLVVDRLLAADCSVRVQGRGPRVAAHGGDYVRADFATGEGVATALRGVSTVVHCAGSSRGDDHKARRMVHAAVQGGVRHIVNISVVGAGRVPVTSGVDRVMFGYYAAKAAAERAIIASGIPWSNLRATQFHQLILTTVRGMSRVPVIPVPRFRFQPIDAAEVADRLVALACSAPAGAAGEMGGPRTYTMAELLRSYLHVTSRRRVLVPMSIPGNAARALMDGANLSPQSANGGRSWEDFLRARFNISMEKT